VFAGGLFSLLQFAASGGDHFGSQGRVEGCDGQRNRLRCELVAAIQEGGESRRNGAAFGLTIAFVTSGVEPCGGIRVFVEDSHHAQSLNGAEFAVVVILERTGVGLPGQLILANVDGFKEGAQAKVICLSDGIVLVVVAVGAVEGESKKGFAGVFDDVPHPVVGIERVPVANEVTGGGSRLVVTRANFVSGQHFLQHAVVAVIGVERVDDPVAPAPDLWSTVPDVGDVASSVPVSVAPDIHPVAGPAFTVTGISQQSIDSTGEGGGVGIIQEGG